MSKFGELIDLDIPVLFDFYTASDMRSESMHLVLKDVVAALGEKAKVIKIDVDKNRDLAEALRVKALPTLIIYKSGEMKWRHSGTYEANTLIAILQQYI